MSQMMCHIDGLLLDNCVLDVGREDCCDIAGVLVSQGKCREDCTYWRMASDAELEQHTTRNES